MASWKKLILATGSTSQYIKGDGSFGTYSDGVGLGDANTWTGVNIFTKATEFTGQNLTHGASRIKVSQESTALSEFRFYGADTSTAGSLRFVGSSSDGSVGGTRMTIDSSGNVGIGTTAPMADSDGIVGLQISSGTATGLTLKSTGSSQVYSLWADDSDNLKITDNTANLVRFAIDSSGNVVIGSGSSATAYSTADNLSVHGSGDSGISILSGSTSNGSLIFGDSEDNNVGQVDYDHNTNTMAFITGASTALSINASQNATFSGSVQAEDKLTINRSGTGANNWDMMVSHYGSSDYGSLFFDSNLSTGSFYIRDSSDNVDFAVKGDGLVGIGAGATPLGILDVRKNSSKVGFGTSSSAEFGQIYFGSGVAINFAHETNDNAGGIINFRGYDNGTSQFRDLTIMDGKGGTVAFFDGSAKRIGINNSAPTMELEIHQSTLAHGSNVGIRFYAENDSGTARDGHIIFDPDTQTIGLSKAGSAVDLGVTASAVESVKNVNIDTGGTTSLTVDGNNTSGDDGRIYLKGYSSSGSRAYININNGVSSGGQNWYVGALRGSNSFAIGRGDDFGTNTDFYINSSGHAYFDNNVYIGNDKAIWFRNNADNADTSAIFTNTSDELVFRSGGSNDTVKINTTGLLTLQGSASPLFLMKNNDGNQQVQINCNTTSGAELDIYDHASSGKIRLSARSGSNSYWNTAGDSHFGIGTASPSKLFTVQSVQANEWLAKFENDSTTNPYGIYVDTTGASGLTYNFASYTGGGTGFFVRNDGVVGIGVDQPKIRLGQKLGLATTANYGGMSMNTYSANASQCSLLDFNKSNNATIGSHTAVANNTDLGYIVFRGSDGVEFLDACYIRASVDDAITGGGTDDMPGRMTFWTTPNGSPSPVERMRINSKGNIGLGRDPETAYSKELVVSCADNGGLTLFSENTAHASCIMFADGIDANAYRGQMVYDHNVDAFGIWTSGTNQFWIDQYGNTGIGTMSPTDYDTSNHQVTSLALAGTWGGRYDNVFGSNVRSSWYMDTSQNTYFGTVGDYNLFLTQNGNTKVTIGSSAVTIANAVTISSASPIITLTDTDDNSDGRIVNGNGVLYLDADLNNEVSGSAISLRVDGGVEVMNVAKGLVQIPAKDLLVGADVNNGTKYVKLHGSANGQIDVGGTGTVSDTRMSFINDNGSVGTIKTAGSGTNYNTTSDYRLKENEVTLSDGLTKLEKLKPYRFNFKVDKDTTVDGFFAHEVQEIVPEAVSGEKDAVDSDGNIDAQGIDHSKLVPLLVKAVQELSAKVKELEAKV